MREPVDIETEWSNELGETVEIREFPDFHEVDLYINGHFAQTFVSLDALEEYLGYYACKRDFGLGRMRA